MQVDRLSVTLDPRLGTAVRKAAERANMSISAWIAEAAADRVRNELLGVALDRWEAEEGPFTAAELEAAAKTLAMPRRTKSKRL